MRPFRFIKCLEAIKASDGSLVAPDGTGTTQGTIKLDLINSKWTYSTTIAHTKTNAGCSFKDVTCDSSIGDEAKLILKSLAMLPDSLSGTGIDATYGGDQFYVNNGEDERCLIRGGGWGNGANAGVFYSALNNPRSDSNAIIGGRSASLS